jgi:hypothetical protein
MGVCLACAGGNPWLLSTKLWWAQVIDFLICFHLKVLREQVPRLATAVNKKPP